MNLLFNANAEVRVPLDTSQRRSTTRLDESYRIFRITRKQRDDSDEDINGQQHVEILHGSFELPNSSRKKSFKASERHTLDGWRRKSTKNKRLLFLHKTSCESTSNDAKTPPSSSQTTGDLLPSINCNDATGCRSSRRDKQINIHSFESDVLAEAIDENAEQNELTLNNLLARADQLETSVKSQEFNKIQRVSRTSLQRKRKRFIVTCVTVLLILTVIITIILVGMMMTLRYRNQERRVTKPSLIYDSFR